METLLGPLEALATKIEWSDVAPAWDGLVAAFRAGRDLDLSRLREFGATLEEVATADRGAPGHDHALKIARAAVMVANAAAVAQGDVRFIVRSFDWGEPCTDGGSAVEAPDGTDPLARRSMIDRISCRSLRGWKNWKKMSLSAGSNGRQATEEPTEGERLSQEVTDLMLELTARRQLRVVPLLPPQRASLRDEFPPFDWELGESHFDGWRPSPSAAAEQLFNAIEARDVQGYIASLNVLDGLGADQGSKAVSLALDDVFKARSKPDRSTMANNIGALHAALAGEAGVDEDILARSKEIADGSAPPERSLRFLSNKMRSLSKRSRTLKQPRRSCSIRSRKLMFERYIASLKAMIGLLNDGVDANEATEKTIGSRSDKRKRRYSTILRESTRRWLSETTSTTRSVIYRKVWSRFFAESNSEGASGCDRIRERRGLFEQLERTERIGKIR